MPESGLGFIVYNGRGPLVLVNSYAPGVLVLANREVTVFPDRPAAWAAIRRTRRYVRREELNWDTDYRIARLTPPPSSGGGARQLGLFRGRKTA